PIRRAGKIYRRAGHAFPLLGLRGSVAAHGEVSGDRIIGWRRTEIAGLGRCPLKLVGTGYPTPPNRESTCTALELGRSSGDRGEPDSGKAVIGIVGVASAHLNNREIKHAARAVCRRPNQFRASPLVPPLGDRLVVARQPIRTPLRLVQNVLCDAAE